MKKAHAVIEILEGAPLLHSHLPPRSKDSHKGNYGHVLVLGGNHGMGGAARMAGEAAARTGAGLVSLVVQSIYIGAITAVRPELMCHTVSSQKELQPLLDKASVLVIGAGLGQDQWASILFDGAMQTTLPMIVDADALHFLAEKDVKRKNWILTPHPGEAAKLLKCHTSDIQADRPAAVSALAKQYGGVAVLKGWRTLVQPEGGKAKVCTVGNPGMATGGMGDVLGGIIGGLLAQGVPLADAANLGVWIHATAGDNVAQRQGERGMLATDLMSEITFLINGFTNAHIHL
ncbi:MAG: NAD(P)H-hydrate dehydratase [Gammaproteobacteria bacterium]|jgi:NAD(P)H-hydrate epimerase|nr:NAD(P)H-hydrate dehydratase [Gammaproteobacteria bacterium]